MKKKNQAAASLGSKGGKARWKATNKKQRTEEMKHVASLRWNKDGRSQRKPNVRSEPRAE